MLVRFGLLCVSFCMEIRLMTYKVHSLYFGACESELCPLNGPYSDPVSTSHYYVYSGWLESKLPLLIGVVPSYTKYYRNWRYFTVYFDCFGEEGYFPINDSFTQCVNNVYYCCFIWSLFGTLCSIQFLLFIFTYEDMSTPKYTFFVYWIRWGMRTVLNVSVKPCLSKGCATIARGPAP